MSATKTAAAKKPKVLKKPVSRIDAITRSIKGLLVALGQDVTVLVVLVGDDGYDIGIRFADAAQIADEIKQMQKDGKDVLIFSGAKPRRRAPKSTAPTA